MAGEIKIAWPSRKVDLGEDARDDLVDLRRRGERVYSKMEKLADGGGGPKAVSPRESEREGLQDRAWVEINDDAEGRYGGEKEYHMFGVDIVDAGGNSVTGQDEAFIGVSREGKLVPRVLRLLPIETQDAFMTAMETRLAEVETFAAQTVLQRG